jgi:hypothetical protein
MTERKANSKKADSVTSTMPSVDCVQSGMRPREFVCPNCMTPGISFSPDPRFDELECHFCNSLSDD